MQTSSKWPHGLIVETEMMNGLETCLQHPCHMHNEKIAEAKTRTPQDAYEYTIRREKGIEHSRTMKINPFGGQTTPKKNPYII